MPPARDIQGPPPLAWRSPASHLRLWLVLVLVLAADLSSKRAVFAWLGEPDGSYAGAAEHHTFTVIGGLLQFQTQYNYGAAMGILPGYNVLFRVAGLASLGLFLYLFALSHRRQWFLHIGVAMVLAGALGNIYDRQVLHRVRDFIHVTTRFNVDLYGDWPRTGVYPWIFNVADMALVVGIVMIMLSWLRQGRVAHRESAQPARPEAASDAK